MDVRVLWLGLSPAACSAAAVRVAVISASYSLHTLWPSFHDVCAGTDTHTGYKNLVGARRASWRILQSVEQSELAKGNEKRVKLIQKYRATVEKELDNVCGEILELLDTYLIPSASSCEASVFYLKMKADYHRYLSEFKVDSDRKEAAEKTLMAYNAAQEKALAELPSTNPIRLGLALNFSVFYYEVMNQPEKACNLAKQVRAGKGVVVAVSPHRMACSEQQQRRIWQGLGCMNTLFELDFCPAMVGTCSFKYACGLAMAAALGMRCTELTAARSGRWCKRG